MSFYQSYADLWCRLPKSTRNWKRDERFRFRGKLDTRVGTIGNFLVYDERTNFASRVEPFVSRRWILDNVFNLSEEEISTIEDEMLAESRN